MGVIMGPFSPMRFFCTAHIQLQSSAAVVWGSKAEQVQHNEQVHVRSENRMKCRDE